MGLFARQFGFRWMLGMALAVLVGAVSYAQAQTPTPPPQLEQGARLYAENCAVCHGPNGEGRVGATLAKNWPSIRPDLRIRATIENGIAGSPMPAWSQRNGGPLSDAEIEALVAYILSWESGGPRLIPPTPTFVPRPRLTPPPQVEGDPNRGAALFDQNCAVCHGPHGEGRIGARLAKPWSSIRPDLEIKSAIVNGIGGSPMPAWSQANGGPLTEAEINDLVAFVMTLPPAEVEAFSPTPGPLPRGFMSGWGGILLTVILFILLVWVAIALQTRRKPE